MGWKGANKKFVWLNRAAVTRNQHNAMRDKGQLKVATERLLKKERRKRGKLTAFGIQYDFPGYAGAQAREKKRKKLAKKVKSESNGKTEGDTTDGVETAGEIKP